MKKFFFFCLLVSASTSFAQPLWQPIPESAISLVGERRTIPQRYKTMWLNINLLEPLLATAPERFTAAAELVSGLPILSIPNPEGRIQRFRLTESPVMAPALQAQFPNIRTYTGYGIDDPTAVLKCDLTMWGFHAMVRSVATGTYYIDPYSFGDRQNYVVYHRKDRPIREEAFVCQTLNKELEEAAPTAVLAEQGDCQLRRYDLALACTGEYAAYFGGTTAGALSAMTNSMNRINGVFEDEAGVTLMIIANNSLIIYLNGATDPFDNTDSDILIGQNQANTDAVIGSANYDIGHVFATGTGGGLAGSGPCQAGSKASGVTGRSNPVGDGFDIDYVIHEMGHQFSAAHTYNGSGGSCSSANGASGQEPGSGTTIMAYAGICGGLNVQTFSDDYFHARSLQQIGNYTLGTGSPCATIISSTNVAPTVNGGSDYTIPISTPFTLTATSATPAGVSYNWEGTNTGAGTQPPAGTNTTGPIFRSFEATASPSRTFPNLQAIINNTATPWEVLPSVPRTLTFRVTVRNVSAAYGCTEEDDVSVTVASSGPFAVTAPSATGITWGNSTQNVTWSVNGTTAAPVSCANVNILLSTDGGNTFPITLAANTPNDGAQVINVPLAALGLTSCRVKIEAVGNIFFDMSNNNFAIAAVLPVELTGFQARLENENTALLTWTTASETNNRGFHIEMKHEDDKDFQNAGFVAGKGTSTEQNDYQFRIPKLTAGTWYFRLKQMDFDGKGVYSTEQAVQVKDRFSVKVFPNPVQNELNLVLFQENNGTVSFNLVNQLGQRFDLLTTQSFDKGFSSLQISVASLPNGVYYYTCHGENGTSQGKIVVDRH